MTLELTSDNGQALAAPLGRTIGFIDGPAACEAFADEVRAAGFLESQVEIIHGEDGIRLLERLKNANFFFGDSEDDIIQTGLKELAQGHYAVAVVVADREQAEKIASLAKAHGGHDFSHFGTWITEQL